MIGCQSIFKVDQELLKQTEWFDLEVTSETHTDFFWKTSTNYTKKAQAITADDIF
jgi:ribonucleoside-diphosphate reductase beta chain